MIKKENISKHLVREVNELIAHNTADMDEKDRKCWLADLADHGCISGMVSGLIYYKETEAFAEKHREAIMELLADALDEGSIDGDTVIEQIKGETFDNWIAWFAFEYVALSDLN
jgi:hypothetical protein